MRKLSVQFHAMPHEIPDLMSDLFRDKTISVVEAFGSPLQFRVWEGGHVPVLVGEQRAFAFTLGAPDLNASSINEFRNLNPDALVLDIGRITAVGLSQSWLSAMTGNESVMRLWRKAARRLRDSTLTGAMAVNPRSGATAPMKWNRFTLGAQRAFARGMAILPVAGDAIVQLPFPDKE